MSNPTMVVSSSNSSSGMVASTVSSGGIGLSGSPDVMMSTTTSAAGTGTTTTTNSDNIVPFWDFDIYALDEWIRSIPVLFPTNNGGSTSHSQSNQERTIIGNQLWENLKQCLNCLSSQTIAPTLKRGGARKKGGKGSTLAALSSGGGKGGRRGQDNIAKKKKDGSLAGGGAGGAGGGLEEDEEEKIIFNDPYQIWFELGQTVPDVMGAKLADLTVGGIVNGFLMTKGGVVDKYTKPIHPSTTHFATTVLQIAMTPSNTVPVKLGMVLKLAVSLHQSIKSRVDGDILIMTPLRIQQILAPELQPHEFKNIRRRVYDTVVLGKGVSAGQGGAIDPEEAEIPVAGNGQNVHDAEKFKKCPVCQNNDQSSFVLDRKNGDVICSQCGVVVSESLMHEGSQYRKFEGEADRNHHGDAANPLYSNAHNMSTTLGGVQVTSGAGMGGFGSQGGGKSGLETILRNAHAYTELNISSFGKEAGRTRVGYKDKQKKQAFVQMAHVGNALNLHEAVIERAKELFAGFRDDRQLVHQLNGVIAACVCEAFDQLSVDGRQILEQEEKQQQQQQQPQGTTNATATTTTPATPPPMDSAAFSNKNSRAARRSQLHKVTMAGKGGLLLDYSNVKTNDNKDATKNKDSTSGTTSASQETSAAASSPSSNIDKSNSLLEMKPAPTWDLEDCRSWLTEASKSIAQYWIDEREKQDRVAAAAAAALAKQQQQQKKQKIAEKIASASSSASTTITTSSLTSNKSTSSSPSKKKIIPEGTRDDLEGRLIGHSITLCEYLETEANNNNNGTMATTGMGNPGGVHPQLTKKSKRVITPRVQDMSKLGIKWQHAHERGSGGKGGVGNSGNNKRFGPGTATTTASGGRKRKLMMSSMGTTTTSSSSTLTRRTPGQILILISAKKLGQEILNGDTIAGDAIHRELRLLIDRQQARKRKELREEATRQRLQQMKRKPWLQARALQDH